MLLKESLVHGINLLIVTSLVIEIESKYVSATRKKIKYRISTLHSFKCVGLRFNLCYKLEHNLYKQKRLLCNRINRSDRYRYPMSLKKSRHVAFEYSSFDFWSVTPQNDVILRDLQEYVVSLNNKATETNLLVSFIGLTYRKFFVGFKGALFQFVLATACSHILSDVAPYNRGAFVFFLYAGPEIFLLLPVS